MVTPKSMSDKEFNRKEDYDFCKTSTENAVHQAVFETNVLSSLINVNLALIVLHDDIMA